MISCFVKKKKKTNNQRIFPQTVGIPMGISCVLILVDLLHYSHEADFIPEILKKNEKKLVLIFNYINDVISLNNSKFDDYLDCIYPTEVEINDTIEITKSLLHTRN